MKLILASNSKSRKKIFDMLGFNYEVVKSKSEEISDKNDFPSYVMDLSKTKANSVAEQLFPEKCLIIAADSIIYMGNKKFEKPKNLKEAYENIKMLSGKVNHAITGVTIKDLYQNKQISFYDTTDVYFNSIDEDEIKWYINNDEHILERAGYSIADGKAANFVKKIDGNYYNILGMPVTKLCEKLKELNYKLSDFRQN